jgi:hypothetical protein
MNKDLEKEKPLELAFQDYYGSIMKHVWFGDGYIMLAFKAGYIVVVSSHSKELSEEIHSGEDEPHPSRNNTPACPAMCPGLTDEVTRGYMH